MISRLHYITQDLPGKSHAVLAEEACTGGCEWIQLRAKNKTFDEWRSIAGEVREVCKSHGVKLIINDNLELAKKVGADGVHLGKNDTSTAEARRVLGPDFIIGGTANTFEDIIMHATAGVDYIGLGPYRFTSTKEKLSPILGAEGYAKIMEQCKQAGIKIPVIAIGGILPGDVESLLAVGVHGVAISSAITNAIDKSEKILEYNLALHSPPGRSWGVGKKRVILPYDKKLVKRARKLRNNSTLSEVILWKYLKGKQRKGFDFDRQRVIHHYIVDFYCKDLMLALEVDGSSHNFKEEQDAIRQAVLEKMGVHFLRFTDRQVKTDIENVLREIDSWIERSGKQPIGFVGPTPNPSGEGTNTGLKN